MKGSGFLSRARPEWGAERAPTCAPLKTALKNSQPFASLVFLEFAGARRDSREAVEEYILLLLEPGRRRPLTRRSCTGPCCCRPASTASTRSTTCPWTSTTARRASYSEVHEELLRTGGNTAAACAERLYSSHLECS